MYKRKEKHHIKQEDILPTEIDPLLIDYNDTSEWLLNSDNSGIDISDDFLNLLELPVGLDDGPLSQENKEIFQDLRYTSTPKSRSVNSKEPFHDSGFEGSSCKRATYRDELSSHHVLHDITDNFETTANNSFVNVSQLSDLTYNDKKPIIRHVPILRKDINLRQASKTTKDTCRSNIIPKEQMTYYTGIKDYDKAIALIKHLKMPKCNISSFKMLLMALMKLRLDLQWQDMAFRFSISELDITNVVRKVIDIMSTALDHFIPWHLQRKINRKTVKSYYLNIVNNGSSQVLILVVDGKKPVQFVSDSYNLNMSPILIVLNDCASQFIPGDIICVNDMGQRNSFYKINITSSGIVALILENPPFSNFTFVENCRSIFSEMLADFAFLNNPLSTFNLSKLTKVSAALFNINKSREISSSQLQKVYENSYRFITIN